MSNPVVVIPAYSRAISLERLLSSILDAYYPDEGIKIIISLDGGYDPKVFNVAKKFKNEFKYGDVDIIARKKNIGLRRHIIECGDLSEKYGSCIILEDDLIVSKCFYLFSIACINKYSDEERIAGFSLYSQRYNEYANLPFEPSINRITDIYLMQVACSWGQVWTREQWKRFKNWYVVNKDLNIREIKDVPLSIALWPDSSWKKYFSTYLIIENKFYTYPYCSFTSNCADMGGMHSKLGINTIQVPINFNEEIQYDYKLLDFDLIKVKYDGFMEYILPNNYDLDGINARDIVFDVYGLKTKSLLCKSKYVITSKRSIMPISYMPLRFKTIENNIYFINKEIKSDINFTESKDVIEPSFIHTKWSNFILLKYFSYNDYCNVSFGFSWLYFLCINKFDVIKRKIQ